VSASHAIDGRLPFVHGQDIGAGELEMEVSSWDAVRFARLCNVVAWASAWQGTQALPAFAERVIVADNGIDAQCQGDLSSASLQPNLSLLKTSNGG